MAKFTYILCLAGVFLFTNALAQRGKVIKPASTPVLDPNGDGYVSALNTGFSNDGYYVDEFEIPMFGLPKSADGEVLNDIQAGANCGTTELTYDNRGFSVYGVLKSGNLIFRFRVANDRPSVEAYSVLIDTDGKIGADDPNSTPENPGFEIDITLIKNNTKGIYVYNIDGIESCPTPLLHYELSSNFQIAVADEVSCSDPDYFYDYYVPFADVASIFNISVLTELRFVALTNVSATCAMAGKISDIGGVDDTPYNGCNSCAFLDLGNNQCPTSLSNLCPTCQGFKTGVTPKPSIDTPLKAGELEITGKSIANSEVYLSIFDLMDALKEKDTVIAGASATWLKVLASPLAIGDSITAQARAIGQCFSGGTSSGTSFTIVVQNIPPVLAGSPGSVQYTENANPVAIAPALTVTDTDDTEIDGATITLSAGSTAGQDILSITPASGITGSYDATTGIISLAGTATLAEYQAVLRTLTFRNTSEDPATIPRTVQITVTDGLDNSNIYSVNVTVVSVNDAPVVSSPNNTVTYAGAPLIVNNAMSVADADSPQLTSATITISNNFVSAQDGLVFSNQNGITGSYDASTGVLTLTGAASLANYAAALSSIQYSNSSGTPSQLTRRISYVVNDGATSSNAFQSFIDFPGINNPPVIVDENNNPIDNLSYTINEDTELNACLNVTDADGDPVALSAFTNVVGPGTFTVTSSLCFKFVPPLNSNGQVTAKVSVCDQTTGSLCDIANVTITIVPVNDPLVVSSMSVSTVENSPIDICVTYTDIENDPAIFTQGLLKRNSGTVSDPTAADACFRYAPKPGFVGKDTVTVQLCDGNNNSICATGLVFITVSALPNHPPGILINGIPGDTLRTQIQEDSSAVVCFEAIDPEGNDVTLSGINKISTAGGNISLYQNIEFCFLYTPVPNFNGTVAWDITVCDDQNPSLCGTVKLIIDVIPVNDPPSIVTTVLTTKQDSVANFCLVVTDVENDPSIFTSGNSQLSLGSVSDNNPGDQCFIYTPKADFYGVDSVRVTVCDVIDNTVCTTAELKIEVLPKENLPPVFSENEFETDTLLLTVKEDSTLNFCFNATDPNKDSVFVSGTQNIKGGGILKNNNGFCFSFTPIANFNGISEWDLFACDDRVPSLCGRLKIIITVTPVNDPPQILNQAIKTKQDSAITVCLQITDTENDPGKFFQGSSILSLGTISDSDPTDLCFRYTPPTGKFGDDVISVTVCDSNDPAVCTTTSLVVEVFPLKNLPPEIFVKEILTDTITMTLPEDSVYSFCFTAIDPNKDPVTLSNIVNTQGGGLLTKISDFCFTFKPTLNFFGLSTWTITVCDNGTPSLCGTLVTIFNVIPVNDAPFAGTDTITVQRNVQGFLNVLANDTDVEGDQLTVSQVAVEFPAHGQYVLSGNGELVYVSDRYYKGSDQLRYSVCDNGVPVRCSDGLVLIEVDDLPLKPYEGFSPNGDGANDYWRIEGVDFYSENLVQIFDRYNNLVFEMSGYNNENKMWRGESNHGLIGGKLPEGVYYYAITLEKGASPLKGFVVLKRE